MDGPERWTPDSILRKNWFFTVNYDVSQMQEKMKHDLAPACDVLLISQ